MAAAAAKVQAVFLAVLGVFADLSSSRGPCDPLTPEYCQLPWPNSFFTRPDAGSATGLRVNMSLETWPKDSTGRGVDPADWNTMGEPPPVCRRHGRRASGVKRGVRVGVAGVGGAAISYTSRASIARVACSLA